MKFFTLCGLLLLGCFVSMTTGYVVYTSDEDYGSEENQIDNDFQVQGVSYDDDVDAKDQEDADEQSIGEFDAELAEMQAFDSELERIDGDNSLYAQSLKYKLISKALKYARKYLRKYPRIKRMGSKVFCGASTTRRSRSRSRKSGGRRRMSQPRRLIATLGTTTSPSGESTTAAAPATGGF